MTGSDAALGFSLLELTALLDHQPYKIRGDGTFNLGLYVDPVTAVAQAAITRT